MGGVLAVRGGVAVRARAVDVAGATAELVLNGEVRFRRPIAAADATVDFQLEAPCGWIAVNLRDGAGHLVLIGNPIYLQCR